MKKTVNLLLISLLACIMYACNGNNKSSSELKASAFPYQSYLDSIGKDETFPTIGDDGNGFNAISDNIRYPDMPDTLSLSHFADSLLQFYNIAIAFNTMAYDISTAERYMNEGDFGLEQADALDSINVSGIHDPGIKGAIVKLCRKAAEWIREDKKPTEQQTNDVDEFYKVFNAFTTPMYEAHLADVKFNPSEVMDDYANIHSKAISDTATFRNELLRQVMQESDFNKKCILAREFAYANYKSPYRKNCGN